MDTHEDRVELAVSSGSVSVLGSGEPAVLRWQDADIVVTLDGDAVSRSARHCDVNAGQTVVVRVPDIPSHCSYDVVISGDRMQASLCVTSVCGTERFIENATAASELTLTLGEHPLPAAKPSLAQALQDIGAAGVCHGVDRAAVQEAISDLGSVVVIAMGTPAYDGSDAALEPLLDVEELAYAGVLAGTALARFIPKIDERHGTDVTGKEVRAKVARDLRVNVGSGARLDDQETNSYVAALDGRPVVDPQGFVDVDHVLELEAIGTESGDVDFVGSVYIRGDVGGGRRVKAGHALNVDGNVERARLESGDTLVVKGTVTASTARAGGTRAVSAAVVDILASAPAEATEAFVEACELCQAAVERGMEMRFALALQLVLERKHKELVEAMHSAAGVLIGAGELHVAMGAQFEAWARMMSAAAVSDVSETQFRGLVTELSAVVQGLHAELSASADMCISSVQASELEATGVITIAGRGVFSTKLVAWGGIASEHAHTVVRGGELVSHGPVAVSELGSPHGAAMKVQLGEGASLEAQRVYAGVIVSTRHHAHRFVADRSHVQIGCDHEGLTVESLAA